MRQRVRISPEELNRTLPDNTGCWHVRVKILIGVFILECGPTARRLVVTQEIESSTLSAPVVVHYLSGPLRSAVVRTAEASRYYRQGDQTNPDIG